jgi:hypothetical protein
MKLVNSKIYKTQYAKSIGECMLCGNRLNFITEDEILKATCCNFDYILLETNNPVESKVQVCAFVGE